MSSARPVSLGRSAYLALCSRLETWEFGTEKCSACPSVSYLSSMAFLATWRFTASPVVDQSCKLYLHKLYVIQLHCFSRHACHKKTLHQCKAVRVQRIPRFLRRVAGQHRSAVVYCACNGRLLITCHPRPDHQGFQHSCCLRRTAIQSLSLPRGLPCDHHKLVSATEAMNGWPYHWLFWKNLGCHKSRDTVRIVHAQPCHSRNLFNPTALQNHDLNAWRPIHTCYWESPYRLDHQEQLWNPSGMSNIQPASSRIRLLHLLLPRLWLSEPPTMTFFHCIRMPLHCRHSKFNK